MKNIHVIPTDRPSRLHLAFNKTFILSVEPTNENELYQSVPKNIYITSDEEIKDGTWVIHKRTGKFMFLAFTRSESYNKNKDLKEEFSKIILSTDQDLINDGVQAIEDEFLEWFMKNSSCEVVEVNWIIRANPIRKEYKIIIPKEETLFDRETQEWVFERSSGYNGYRNKTTSKWIYESEYLSKFSTKEILYTEEDLRKAIEFIPYHIVYGNLTGRKSDKDIETFIKQIKDIEISVDPGITPEIPKDSFETALDMLKKKVSTIYK